MQLDAMQLVALLSICALSAADAATNESMGSLNLGRYGSSDFYDRSLVVPWDWRPIGRAMQRARSKGQVRIAIWGGSTSAGGGTGDCGPRELPACGANCCGAAYPYQLARWLRESQGIKAQVQNHAVSATGPSYAARCVGTMLAGQNASRIDIILIEFAINALASDVVCKRDLDKLLWRLRRIAPQAAILFVHTFSQHQFKDGPEGCIDPLARYYDLPVVSWKHAVRPLLAAQLLAPSAVFQPPLNHHPNVGGHKHLASIVAHFLLKAESRMSTDERSLEEKPLVREQKLDSSELPGPRLDVEAIATFHSTILTAATPECLAAGSARLQSSVTSSTGWRFDRGRGWFASAQPLADLTLRVQCAHECSFQAGLTTSYQPLGMLDILVDGALIVKGHSEAHPQWRGEGHLWTLNHFVGLTSAGAFLRAGWHTITFRCLGETALVAQGWWSNYTKHEVHVRSLIILNSQLDQP